MNFELKSTKNDKGVPFGKLEIGDFFWDCEGDLCMKIAGIMSENAVCFGPRSENVGVVYQEPLEAFVHPVEVTITY